MAIKTRITSKGIIQEHTSDILSEFDIEVNQKEGQALRRRTLVISHEDLTADDTTQTFSMGAAFPAGAVVQVLDVDVTAEIVGLTNPHVRLGVLGQPGGPGEFLDYVLVTDGGVLVQRKSMPYDISGDPPGSSNNALHGSISGREPTGTISADNNVNNASAGSVTVNIVYMLADDVTQDNG
jgi:hypothetical protein